ALRARWRECLSRLVSPHFTGWWGRAAYRLHGRHWQAAGDIRLPELQRVCVIRFDGLGDLVTITGFLRELRRSAPRARITLVVRAEWLDLVRECPHVDEVLGLRLLPHRRFAELRWHWTAVRFCARHLWPRRFDAVLVPQTHFYFFETRPMALLALSPRRAGWSDPAEARTEREVQALELFTQVVALPAGWHEVEKGYAFLERLGGQVRQRQLELWWNAAEEQAAAATAAQLKAGARRLVALGIGASHSTKVWPLDRFVELGGWLAADLGAKVVAIGGADMAESGQSMVARLQNVASDMTGKLSVRQTAALLSRCDLFVGNDSGPMHLAAAVQLPVVEISGCPAQTPARDPGSPLRMGPYCRRRAILQPESRAPGTGFCVEAVTVEQVKRAVAGLLGEPACAP
ncbi:MAG: glycosyltransferase family 9 protein, partial [Verrucomicrobia bacterium]|nr:glycosyltransferase family 9 protein [Verrucomicrobiota bacterium]